MHGPTCAPAIDPGASGSTLTTADTSRPSRSSGNFADLPWSGSPWLAHASPLHGDWFPNPTGLLLAAFCHPPFPAPTGSRPRDVPFPFANSPHRPTRRVPWCPAPKGLLSCPCRTSLLAPPPPLIPHPVFIPHRAASSPVARAHWILIRLGTVSCSLHGSLLSRPLYSARLLRSPDRSRMIQSGVSATFPMSRPHWPTCVMAREQGASKRL